MNNLNYLIKERGLNNPKLAKLIGCKPVEIWRLAKWPDKGGRKISPEWAERIAPHLGVSSSELLFGKTEKQSACNCYNKEYVEFLIKDNRLLRETIEKMASLNMVEGK